ncbi:MAG: aminodeoxychorismate/anthranilate synthase component II [Cytophagales bacterium]|nr:aminodeoxychorismate/anthranilate synthase component II [Cytophagales bacterium]
MILVVDNLDSFTYNLVDYFHQLDLEVHVVRNNAPLEHHLSGKYQAVVLSPGPGIPGKAGHLMEVLHYYRNKIPVLGICLGHQAIAQYYNGKIVKAQRPMHGKISEITHSGDPLFENIPEKLNVVRYHSLICRDLPGSLNVIAKTESNEIMAIKHKQLPVYGLQFHPEAVLTQFGLGILRNWKNINSLTN